MDILEFILNVLTVLATMVTYDVARDRGRGFWPAIGFAAVALVVSSLVFSLIGQSIEVVFLAPMVIV